jgi:hypothetical protein
MSLMSDLREEIFQLSQGEMAALMNTTQPTIWRWENTQEVTLKMIRAYRDKARELGLAWPEEKIWAAVMEDKPLPRINISMAAATVDVAKP